MVAQTDPSLIQDLVHMVHYSGYEQHSSLTTAHSGKVQRASLHFVIFCRALEKAKHPCMSSVWVHETEEPCGCIYIFMDTCAHTLKSDPTSPLMKEAAQTQVTTLEAPDQHTWATAVSQQNVLQMEGRHVEQLTLQGTTLPIPTASSIWICKSHFAAYWGAPGNAFRSN